MNRGTQVAKSFQELNLSQMSLCRAIIINRRTAVKGVSSQTTLAIIGRTLRH